jgi:hypothetical protein
VKVECEPGNAVDALQGDFYFLVENQRFIGRDQATLAADEEFEADPVFERAQAPTDCGLAQVQLASRCSGRARVDDGPEALKAA